MFCEGCEDRSVSEDDFTVVSLHIPSNKEVTVHLKFYPADPREGSIMIEYKILFESDQSLINEVLNELELCKNEGIYYEYYKTSDSDQELVSINKHSPIKEIGEINNSNLCCIVHLYELNPLKANCKYFDFKLCDDKEEDKTTSQTSVFKIPVNLDASLLDFHCDVLRHTYLYQIKRNDKDFVKYLNELVLNKKERFYRVDYCSKFQNNQTNSFNLLKFLSKSPIKEVGTNKDIKFKKFLEPLKDKKISFKIVILKPTEDEMIMLGINELPPRSIEIKSKYELTLESCLSKFVADEVYPDYSCDKCSNVTNCIMKTKMSLLPKYLIIQLMRFESVYTATQTILTKNDNFVSFPTKYLDLKSISSEDCKDANCIYDLCGVIHHSGSMRGGHYYATVNNDFCANDWHRFNDGWVYPCTEKDAVKKNAYVLFYTKRDD